MKTTTAVIAAALLTAGVGLGHAQEAADPGMAGMDHSTMDHSGMSMDGGMDGMMKAMDTTMQAMPKASTGMVDADFLLMMIPHHQSAIDMARVEIEQGTDEETRSMAQEIIDAQEAEIAEMKTMLARMGVEVPVAPVN